MALRASVYDFSDGGALQFLALVLDFAGAFVFRGFFEPGGAGLSFRNAVFVLSAMLACGLSVDVNKSPSLVCGCTVLPILLAGTRHSRSAKTERRRFLARVVSIMPSPGSDLVGGRFSTMLMQRN